MIFVSYLIISCGGTDADGQSSASQIFRKVKFFNKNLIVNAAFELPPLDVEGIGILRYSESVPIEKNKSLRIRVVDNSRVVNFSFRSSGKAVFFLTSDLDSISVECRPEKSAVVNLTPNYLRFASVGSSISKVLKSKEYEFVSNGTNILVESKSGSVIFSGQVTSVCALSVWGKEGYFYDVVTY
ncbi:MAG: hypothetical protein N2654_07380 [Deltaproteobacteria bacterium]|nr:hypothetical protein [Deltaproteobacteria bacterium]